MDDKEAVQRAKKMADFYSEDSHEMTRAANDMAKSITDALNLAAGIFLPVSLAILGDPEKVGAVPTRALSILYCGLLLIIASTFLDTLWRKVCSDFFKHKAEKYGNLANKLDGVKTYAHLNEINDKELQELKSEPQKVGGTLLRTRIILFFIGILFLVLYTILLIDPDFLNAFLQLRLFRKTITIVLLQ